MLTSLHHLIDCEWMLEAYRLTRKDGAPGIDGMMATDYEANLEANLGDLLARIKSGRYIAPPVRRHYIPKADGTERPLGIPTLEDKVAQRAILLLLEPIYETDFLSCSYGFRPGRSAHDALHALRNGFMEQGLRWVVDVDISKYFDTIDHAHLRRFLDQRVTDGIVRRMIDKWLKAGVLEKGVLRRTTGGTPQGGVISPLLANIYLHYVLDEWFEQVARPRLKGRCQLVRYADDAVIAFEDHLSGKRLLNVLDKRLGRYGLQLHPTKTRFVDFRFKRPGGRHPATAGTTFNFLGFTHVWGQSRKGKNVVRQITAKDRYARALASVTEWCRLNLHRPFRAQHAHLSRVIRGTAPTTASPATADGSDGITTRSRGYGRNGSRGVAATAICRGRASGPCSRDTRCRQPRSSTNMPSRERSLRVKNRMRVIRSSGSVRGGDGNIPAYSAEGGRGR
ncbi:reverse transcriptase/maturase family protein [Bradyrhizobium diazoefficiens]|uniref:Reverse transcriptase/maturase family protein n=4 Tax=Bradyrhizobium TaxID=374 RepID=A0A0E4FVC1_9BRAD|nr:reverse transcriptase/maturase family protein [Bradyrhizobium diazoefficiens]